jgi:hypothetical protein
MGQYLQFRSWLRTSSGAERGLAVTSVAVVVGLTAWSLFPTTSPDQTTTLQTQAGGPPAAAPVTGATNQAAAGGAAVGPSAALQPGAAVAPGAAAPGAAGPGATTTGGTGPAAAAPRTRPAGATGGSCPAGPTDIGVSATQINVAAVLINLAGAIGNGAVGLASPDDQRKMSDAVVADINAHGGVACRKIAVTYYEANPIDSSSAQKACLAIAQAKIYSVLDLGGFAYPQGSADCVAQHKIPIMTGAPVPSELKQYYPYLMSGQADVTVADRTSVLGLKRLGWFDPAKGFKKLGLYMDECSPEVNNSLLKDLAGIGLAQKDISIYKFSCPSGGFGSASDASAAVVQHRQDGVTNMIPVTGGGSFKSYSSVAQQQGYRPKYTALDYNGQYITTTGATGPDQDGFDGSIGITTTRIGMESSGFSDPATDACKAVFKRHGLDPAWVTSSYLGGNTCTYWNLFAAAANKAPSLTRINLGHGLEQVGRLGMAYVFQDSIYKPGKLSGADFSWVVQYRKSCNCWKVIDRTPRASAY